MRIHPCDNINELFVTDIFVNRFNATNLKPLAPKWRHTSFPAGASLRSLRDVLTGFDISYVGA